MVVLRWLCIDIRDSTGKLYMIILYDNYDIEFYTSQYKQRTNQFFFQIVLNEA